MEDPFCRIPTLRHDHPIRLAVVIMIAIAIEIATVVNSDRWGRGGRSNVHWDKQYRGRLPCCTDIITHLSCNCGGSDINGTYRQCLISIKPSTAYYTALTLFVNREIAKWLELQQTEDTKGGALGLRSSRHDIPTAEVGLAGIQLSSSI